MSAEPQHWVATDEGSARKGNEDAYLWLGPDDTGGNGGLWLVVDGEGGAGVGDLAAAMVTTTVSELYGALVGAQKDPVLALRSALEEANRRLGVIGETYPRLARARASFAAVAHYDGKLYPVVAGSAAAFVVTPGGVRRIGARDVARHERGDGDRDLVPGSGVGVDGPLVHHAEAPIDPDFTSIVLCTDGVTELVPDALIGEAVERLAPKDAATGLIEVARRRWSDDDATAAVVRFVDPNLQVNTTLKAFLDWADSGLTKWPDQTLVLQVGGTVATEPPPRSNVSAIPTIEGEALAPGADAAAAGRTLGFSRDDVAAIVAASAGAAGAPGPSNTAPQPAAPGSPERTTLPAGPDSPGPVSTSPTASTPDTARSPAERVESGAPPKAASPQAPSGDRPAATGKGTLFFSPQDIEQVRAAADSANARPESVPAGRRSTAPLVDRTLDLGEEPEPAPPFTRDFSPVGGAKDTSTDDVATTRRSQLTDDELALATSRPWLPAAVIVGFVLVGILVWLAVLR